MTLTRGGSNAADDVACGAASLSAKAADPLAPGSATSSKKVGSEALGSCQPLASSPLDNVCSINAYVDALTLLACMPRTVGARLSTTSGRRAHPREAVQNL